MVKLVVIIGQYKSQSQLAANTSIKTLKASHHAYLTYNLSTDQLLMDDSQGKT